MKSVKIQNIKNVALKAMQFIISRLMNQNLVIRRMNQNYKIQIL